MLFDALREDFVEFDSQSAQHTRIKPENPDFYKGKKLSFFKDLHEAHPDRTVFLPMQSAVPTVTSVRIKSLLSGGLSTFFESTEEFVSTQVNEDNILYQAKNRVGGHNQKVEFIGDDIWSAMYGQYFDKMTEFPSTDTRDLDTLDRNVQSLIK